MCILIDGSVRVSGLLLIFIIAGAYVDRETAEVCEGSRRTRRYAKSGLRR